MSRNMTLRLLAVGLLLCWCGVFLRPETTDKSMVRALMLERRDGRWSVGLLYQFPEAAADSSEAAAKVRVCIGTGDTLEQAKSDAEKKLPQRANYRLCDYLLVQKTELWDVLRTGALLVQEHPELRMAMRVFGTQFPGTALDAAAQEDEQLPETLLSCIKTSEALAPRVYEQAEGMLLPVLQLEEDGPVCSEEALLLSEQGTLPLSASQTRMADLLTGRGKEHAFWLDGHRSTFRRTACSVEAEGEEFHIVLDLRPQAGTERPSEDQRRQLEALCVETVRQAWKAGIDLLSLGAVRALKEGDRGEPLTTKNACPQLQADVRFWK